MVTFSRGAKLVALSVATLNTLNVTAHAEDASSNSLFAPVKLGRSLAAKFRRPVIAQVEPRNPDGVLSEPAATTLSPTPTSTHTSTS
ncbi:MAG: hypothetical protein IAF58_16135, partial [Leptolyngbya sp.]|nr:hypothetical protein [Candidatus Melainabacteria bacterium]